MHLGYCEHLRLHLSFRAVGQPFQGSLLERQYVQCQTQERSSRIWNFDALTMGRLSVPPGDQIAFEERLYVRESIVDIC